MTIRGEGDWKADRLEEALRDILDVVAGWTRPMTDAEKLEAIREMVEGALR